MTNLNQGPAKGGQGERPNSSRPDTQPSQPELLAPNLEQMESAKTALLTFCMYYYQALREAGHDIDSAKRTVADEILALYDRYAQHARLTFKPDRIRDPHSLLEEIIADTKSMGIQGKSLHQKLSDFKRLIQD